MRVSLEWLSEYVDISGLSPQAIAEALTNAGLEVESIENLGGAFSGVVLGKIRQVAPHPNADRLRLVTVDLGASGQNQVVCGAPNVAEGMRIAYAQIGATVLNRKEGTTFTLGPATIRGVESTGMICSIDELGLQEQYPKMEDGIWPLTDVANDTDLGRDLKEVLQLKTDTVLEVTPNANRGDLMSMLGVAREVAALFGRGLKLPSVDIQPVSSQTDSAYQVKLSDPDVCPYYAGAVLENVTIGPSPDWLRQRLTHAGIRPINNVVDITNYVMLELGQPLHAFDIHQLGPDGTVDVRRAKPGETLKTLDGMERTLSDESVIVTFNNRPVALAGVMGGEETEISESTTQVFLESAHFVAPSTRRSARSVGLRSDASARFERGVDITLPYPAMMRAVQLFSELAGARCTALSQDDRRSVTSAGQAMPFQEHVIEIQLNLKRIPQILGIDIPKETVQQTLAKLGFAVSDQGESLDVKVPAFRAQDVTREIDLIEEVIRIYGYDKIPYTLPSQSATPEKTSRAKFLDEVRQAMTGAGLMEVTTLSLIGDSLLQRTGFSQDSETTVRVTNSQSRDHTFLRQSLAPTLLEVAKHNQAQGNEDVWIFELGKTYFKTRSPQEKDPGVSENLYLGAVLTGNPYRGEWHENRLTDYYTAKGLLENLFQLLGIQQQIRWSAAAPSPAFHPGQTAQFKLGKTALGLVGRLHPTLEEKLKFKLPVYLLELDLDAMFAALAKRPAFSAMDIEALSAYPAVKRDIALVAPNTVSHSQVVSTLNQANEPLLTDIQLFDEYRGAQVGEGQRSLAYRITLQSSEATLTEAQIDTAVDKLKRQLSEKLSVSLR